MGYIGWLIASGVMGFMEFPRWGNPSGVSWIMNIIEVYMAHVVEIAFSRLQMIYRYMIYGWFRYVEVLERMAQTKLVVSRPGSVWPHHDD